MTMESLRQPGYRPHRKTPLVARPALALSILAHGLLFAALVVPRLAWPGPPPTSPRPAPLVRFELDQQTTDDGPEEEPEATPTDAWSRTPLVTDFEPEDLDAVTSNLDDDHDPVRWPRIAWEPRSARRLARPERRESVEGFPVDLPPSRDPPSTRIPVPAA
ncbi:MAG: hypothetical protein KDB53_21110, partial [Planctomycetes bacterium]|nr:hypothetical protein [Planctomycetota bacterium]